MTTVTARERLVAAAVGVLIGAIAVGAILANPVIGRSNNSPANRRRLMAAGLLLAAPGMIVLAVTPQHGLVLDVFAAMLIGFGWEFVFIGGQSTVAVEVPEGVRGRMMGLFFVLVTATTAVGAVGLGVLINAVGMTTAFLGTATVVVAAGIAMLTIGVPAPPQLRG